MSDVEFSEQLNAACGLGDQKAKAERYAELLSAALSAASVERCKAFVEHILSDRNPLVVSRQLLSALAADIGRLPAEAHKEVASFALDRLAPRLVSFEEVCSQLRVSLAAVHESQEAWSAAAAALAGIDLDSGQRSLGATYKLATCVKIARLYLEDDDALAAEGFIKKAAFLLPEAPDEALDLQFKSCYARILDAKRKFLEAARYYYALSTARGVAEEEHAQALHAATVCTILSAAGPPRSRQLAVLYKDERCAALPTYTMLSKVRAFEAELKPHQLAAGGDGLTVLARAVIEHNLAAASTLYANITLPELARLLGIAPDKAERMAAAMIAEGRLRGSLDQPLGLLTFERAAEAPDPFDARITQVSLAVQNCVDVLKERGLLVAPATVLA